MYFQKPSDTRLNITGGDGKGSAAVWHGGDTVTGHQGGWLSAIRFLPAASTSSTLAALKSPAMTADTIGGNTTITVPVADSTKDNGVTKEVLVLGKDSLPVEYDQYEGDQQVKHVVYSDVMLNATIPPATWSI